MRNSIQPLNYRFFVQGVLKSVFVITLAFFGLNVQAQDYTLTKNINGVSESGTPGLVSVSYSVTLTNNAVAPTCTDLQIVDDVDATFGGAFAGVDQAPVITASTAMIDPLENAAYSGDAGDPRLLDGSSGLLAIGESVTITYSVLFDAAIANGDLTNTATASVAVTANGAVVQPQPSASVTLQDCWSNCVLACNNQVNISVNTMCEAVIFSEMVLEGEDEICADLGFYTVEIYDANDNLLSLPLDVQYIGQQLKAVVTNIACGNSCWANLLVEDKTPPILECDSDTIRCNESISPYNPDIGFPVPVGNITPTADPQKFIATSIDACGEVELEYRDSLVTRDCNDPDFSSLIYRKWRATDASGLTVVCTDTIYFIRGTIADITLPEHYDGLPGNQPVLDCDGPWCALPNGFPRPEACGTGAPEGIFCGNIQFDYYDDTIKICESSYKLFRTWLIIDWCDPNNKVEFVQRIKVVDEDGPIVIAPPKDPLVLKMDQWACERASYIVPAPVYDPSGASSVSDPYIPNIIDECGSWTYRVEHLSVDETIKDPSGCAAVDDSQIFNTYNVRQLSDGRWELFDIPQGCNWIKYIITDDCGNTTTFSFDLFIEDDVAPIAVCHEHTVVALTSDGKARVNAATFDDGSHDNCAMGRMEVRRMSKGNCPSGVQDDTQFRDYVEFCCNDIADNPIMVVLRVWDECGNNYSECMVEVTVQDKLPPIMTYCPDDVRITCEDDYTPLSQFGMAEAFDNCNFKITVDSSFNISSCGTGTITRTFTATDDGGRQASCTQVITIYDAQPFTVNDIMWPGNKTLQDGCMSDTDPDNTGRPTFKNEDKCNQIAVAYDDLVFSQVDGACLKILREWRVVDWCQFDRSAPDECYPNNIGRWCFTQVIMVHDTEGPQFTSDCNDKEYCITGSDCTTSITLEATAFDQCTPSDQIIWSYELFLDGDNNPDVTGNRNSYTANFTEGTYRIRWTAEDLCGNAEICEYEFDVVDCKKPTPYCKNGITTVVMPTTGTVTLWARDFDAGSFDNCTDTSDLRFSFSTDVLETGRTYSCADIANGISDTISVTVYVWDNEGNFDFCTTSLILQDNQDVCPDNGNLKGMIAGLIATGDADRMKDVEVILESPSMTGSKMYMTDEEGHFAFSDLDMYENYQVKPQYNENPMNGISTLDLVLIQRHLLGYEDFTSPYEYIAADVNNSQTVSAGDISELRKMILGVYVNFPKNESWRFVDQGFVFGDPNDPFPFNETVDFDDFSKDEMATDFVAVKVGDVSGDADPSGFGSNVTRGEQLTLNIESATQVANDEWSLPIAMGQANASEWIGFQFTTEYDADLYEFVEFRSGALQINDGNIAMLEDGLVTFAWDAAEAVEILEGEVLLTAIFKGKHPMTHGLNLTSSVTQALAFDGQRNAHNISGKTDVSEKRFVLHQNTPNPFRGSTTIAFELPESMDYSIEVFDMSGKILRSIDGFGSVGYQSIELDLSAFSESSVLYYQLNTDNYSSTKKMVIIE